MGPMVGTACDGSRAAAAALPSAVTGPGRELARPSVRVFNGDVPRTADLEG
jgi:hypothetical protein